MKGRDALAEIVAYNAPLLTEEGHRVARESGLSGQEDLTAEALRRKLSALASSPFSFFRGTFHLMATDVLGGRVAKAAALAPNGLIVGDLHLENFGTYRGASGELCFDVNDFDDVGDGPADLDLKRLCTSALLLPDLPHATRSATAKAIASSWAEAMDRLGGRFPVPAWDAAKATGLVAGFLKEKGRHTQADLIAKSAPDKGHKTFDRAGTPPKWVAAEKHWAAVVEKAVAEYLVNLEQLKSPIEGRWKVLDVCYRFKGTGSLGRLRFSALIGDGSARRILELKEARPSAMDAPQGFASPPQRARMQAAAIRRLQGDPWPQVAGSHLGGVSALVREIQPEEEKFESSKFGGADDKGREGLLDYASQCGEVLARLHVRMSAPRLLAVDWEPAKAAKGALEFAEGYADQVEKDHRAFVAAQAEVARKLGLAWQS